jgi:hypothetical protein
MIALIDKFAHVATNGVVGANVYGGKAIHIWVFFMPCYIYH